MPKRAAEPPMPAASPAKASPKKAKTPPKKKKEDQTMTYGAPCFIQLHRGPDNIKLWNVIQQGDKTDGFVKNIIDIIRNEPHEAIKKQYDFRGDATRRVSLATDEPMKNYRKSYERKFMIQVSDVDTKLHDIATAKEIQRVSVCLGLTHPFTNPRFAF